MILRDDILSMEFLKKSEYTGCHQGMRYRLEGIEEKTEQETEKKAEKKLLVTIWPEPYNFFKTPEEKKEKALFNFSEEGVLQGINWMNDQLIESPEKWENAAEHWSEQ